MERLPRYIILWLVLFAGAIVISLWYHGEMLGATLGRTLAEAAVPASLVAVVTILLIRWLRNLFW